MTDEPDNPAGGGSKDPHAGTKRKRKNWLDRQPGEMWMDQMLDEDGKEKRCSCGSPYFEMSRAANGCVNVKCPYCGSLTVLQGRLDH